MSEFAIGRRQLYILPTRIGWYFSLILLSLFAIAIKYDNQAAFMMLFILTSVGMVAMLYTHNNVIGLELDSQPARSVFVGETATFPVRVRNQSAQDRQAVWLVCDGFHQMLEIPANEERRVELRLPTVRRGYLNCSEVSLTSQYPIGIFFCWTKRFTPSQRCLVYPQPLDLVPFPEDGSNNARKQTSAVIKANAEDYAGMKPFQPGDRLRDIHWPSLAKTHRLVSIQHEDQSSNSANLSWFSLPPSLGVEDRLSQLCFWVTSAEQQGLIYQLEMPSHTIEYGKGTSHFHDCLHTLALWGHQEGGSKEGHPAGSSQ